ncbi:hypothetical protein ARALYDRAFT_893725 [Arabidopsis lyrata subsp. lyrata]|uniref:Apple domain-containing protein n=1 Tax=Arabidopsis lyrata subsp. lyrata TaxID=81972 RepID=D7KYK2_ARALL|nr:hypothetical protein ARALYDRAFT_893725 [Arabidopsis lyrata subsp. lyrata]
MANRCIRKKSLKCGADKFLTILQMSFPHAENALIHDTNQIQECQHVYVGSCKCTICAITHNLQSSSSKYVTWRGKLLDLRCNSSGSQKLYIQLDG